MYDYGAPLPDPTMNASLLAKLESFRLINRLPSINAKDDRIRLRKFGRVMLFISIFFWSWAVYNTSKMKGGKKDLGIYSFFGSACTSAMIVTKRWSNSPGGIGAIVIFLSYLVVAGNYALGLKFAHHFGLKYFGAYCFVFMILWILAARIVWILISNVFHNPIVDHSRVNRNEDDEEDSGASDEFDFGNTGGGGGGGYAYERGSSGGGGYPY